ncbi:hypothetical protein D3C72_2379580 [compost metagenome]
MGNQVIDLVVAQVVVIGEVALLDDLRADRLQRAVEFSRIGDAGKAQHAAPGQP